MSAAVPLRRLFAPALAALVLGASGRAEEKDPLASEIARWSEFVKTNESAHPIWTDVKASAGPLLSRAEEALRGGRRFLALHRFAAARVNLAAAGYLVERTAGEGKDAAAFEAEWARMGRAMRADLAPPSPKALASVQPAAIRALGEAALPQVRVFYDASLEYGRSTSPDNGLFYLGNARAQREFVELARSISAPSGRRAPALRTLANELDDLEGDLLAAYRPPASIEKHPEFIAASGTLKEARELDAMGLRYGAVLRYLQAAVRVAALKTGADAVDLATVDARLRDLDSRLAAGNVDHTIGRLLLETAQSDRETSGAKAVNAAAIAGDVLPRYFAALEPAPKRPARPAPAATVTLVRWPYT
jgi:hypothetical protein